MASNIGRMFGTPPDWLIGLGAWVGLLAAITTGIAIISRPMRRIGQAIGVFVRDEIIEGLPEAWQRDIAAAVQPILADVDTIHSEVTTNSGASLKDAVLRIEDAVAALTETIDRMNLRVSNVERQAEMIITDELPIITALAERILADADREDG